MVAVTSGTEIGPEMRAAMDGAGMTGDSNHRHSTEEVVAVVAIGPTEPQRDVAAGTFRHRRTGDGLNRTIAEAIIIVSGATSNPANLRSDGKKQISIWSDYWGEVVGHDGTTDIPLYQTFHFTPKHHL